MKKEKINEYLSGLTPEHYINTSEVCRIGGQPIYVWDVMKAALIRKLNVFLIGETGEGKTQLEKDILGLFGNKCLFILGRNDMDIRELFRKISGEKLKLLQEGKIDSDAVRELTDKLGYHIFVVDEQTRCIPAVANQLFNLYDGYIELDGKIYVIGDGYSIGVSSGNIGDGKYIGTSSQDRALLDRMHILLDLDNADFSPTPVDFLQILYQAKGPRVKDAQGKDDKTERIIKCYNALNEEPIPWEHYICALYLRFGLDYLESTTHHSKRHAKNIWPNIPKLSDEEKAGDATLVYPISTRAALTCLELAKGLRAVAEAKGAENIDKVQLFLDTFRITGAYSGILNIDRVNRDPNYEGNLYTALGALNSSYKLEFDKNIKNIFDALALAKTGKLDETLLNQFKGRWEFINGIIKYVAKQNQPVEKSLEDVIKSGGS